MRSVHRFVVVAVYHSRDDDTVLTQGRRRRRKTTSCVAVACPRRRRRRRWHPPGRQDPRFTYLKLVRFYRAKKDGQNLVCLFGLFVGCFLLVAFVGFVTVSLVVFALFES